MQILVATLRGAVHQQQRAAAYAALLPSLLCAVCGICSHFSYDPHALIIALNKILADEGGEELKVVSKICSVC